MSPSIATGPPHSRAASLHGNGPVATDDISRMNRTSAAQAGKRVYPHIEDLINVQPNVDINSPIRKILQDAELLAKQADTHLDFRRPDIALKEHLQASRLVAETIPRHKDYPSLQANQGDLHRKYTGLVKRIKAQEAKFDLVVRDIKEDNLKSGVLPTTSTRQLGDVGLNGAPRNGVTSHSRNTSQALDFENASTTNETNTRNQDRNGVLSNPEHVRKRPPVQPKPQALHGKALESSAHPPIPPQATDLTARFARLRSPAPLNVTQDPRIRTQAITIPQNSQSLVQSPSTPRSSKPPTITRPIGPRELPTASGTLSSPTKAVLDVQIPDMPKPPDAIYSPAGNTDSAATINLPSSVNRNASYLSSGRKNSSAPPVSTATPTPLLAESMQDYFSPAHKVDDFNSLQKGRKRPDLGFLKDSHISAETLFNILAEGLQVLLVDIRRREEFDRGHIMSKSIVCIEPITIREGISADQLGESNILSPDSEQKLYENRCNFDLLVYYDQSSSSTKARGTGDYNERHYLERFSKAVYEYGYEKRLDHRPLMLIGGLDAWVDLLGSNSLQTSFSLSEGWTKSAKPLSRVSNTHDSRQRNHVPRSNSGRQSRLFTKEEESTWDETVKKDTDRQLNLDGQVDSEEFSYHKSTADFLRKYPELPSIQESMISTEPRSTSTRTSNQQQIDDLDSVPKPPTRPAPALPRQRSSGINERGPSPAYAMTSTSNSLTKANPKAGLTGLGNNGVTCYANSVIQCLSATAALRQYLINEYRYPTNPRPPKIESEPGPHPPQLLTRNLANLFTILWSGSYDWVMPKTLLSYINALDAKKLAPGYSAGDGFGGGKKQHDAHEFLTFIFEVLMDELNLLRDRPDFSTGRDSDKLQELSILDSSIHEWMRYRQSQSSFFSREFAGLMAKIVKCANCPYSSKTYDPMTAYQVYFPEEFHRNAPRRAGLQELLQSDINFGSNWDRIHGFTCEKCKRNEGFSLNRFAYLPNHLVLYFPRFQNNLGGGKIQTHIDLDLDSVDLRPFHITTEKDVKVPADADTGFQIPPIYQAYAVAMHRGKDVKYGHYVALTRNLDPTATGESQFWHQYNDQIVSKRTLKDLEDDGFNIAVLFLRRKGTTWRRP